MKISLFGKFNISKKYLAVGFILLTSFFVFFKKKIQNLQREKKVQKLLKNLDLSGKIAIVTGSSSGIGLQIASVLSRKNATVIFACRNQKKTLKVIKAIEKKNKKSVGKHVFIQVDLADLDSVKKFVKQVQERYSEINFLFNNAGVSDQTGNLVTKQGVEFVFGVNHLSHFSLTNLLMKEIIKGNCRIINTSSHGHKFMKKEVFDLKFRGEGEDVGRQKYARSKSCNIMFTKTLARILSRIEGFKGTSYSFHPGLVLTNMFDDFVKKAGVVQLLFFYVLLYPFFISPKQGAQTAIFLAFSPKRDLKNGGYYSECKLQNNLTFLNNKELQDMIWKKSEELCNQKFL